MAAAAADEVLLNVFTFRHCDVSYVRHALAAQDHKAVEHLVERHDEAGFRVTPGLQVHNLIAFLAARIAASHPSQFSFG